MGNFESLIVITYSFGLFVLLFETKSKVLKEGISKLILLALVLLSLYFLIADKSSSVVLGVRIAVFIPLLYFLLVIFTEDIDKFTKKTLTKGGKEKLKTVDNDLAEHLYDAVEYLARNKIGALITIERTVDLSKIINKSLLLNADVSKELLTSIFIPNTPLHDGAVIIRGNKIVCAKAYYPSTKRTDLPMHYGTRHRAAIGISEQSDAFTIVVSEETGNVSVTVNKDIEYNISRETLNLYFEKFLKVK